MNNETINLPLTTKEAQMIIEYLNRGTVSPYTVNDTMLLINKVHAAVKPVVEPPPPPAKDQFVSKNGEPPKETPEQKKSEEVEPSKKDED